MIDRKKWTKKNIFFFMKNPWGAPLAQIFVKNILFEKLTNYTSFDAVSHTDFEYVITFVWK
jgi:hypothetical protein